METQKNINFKADDPENQIWNILHENEPVSTNKEPDPSMILWSHSWNHGNQILGIHNTKPLQTYSTIKGEPSLICIGSGHLRDDKENSLLAIVTGTTDSQAQLQRVRASKAGLEQSTWKAFTSPPFHSGPVPTLFIHHFHHFHHFRHSAVC